MINCTSCAAPADSDDLFCGRCGVPLTEDVARRYSAGNPFRTLKTRWAIPWAILGIVLTYAAVIITTPNLDFDRISPTGALLASNLFYVALVVWMVRQFRRHGVDFRRLLGRLPAGYNWFAMLGIWLATVAFSAGAALVIGYAVSIIAPDELPWLLKDQLIIFDFGNAAYPAVFIGSFLIIGPTVEEVLYRGVLINRWGIKWGFNIAIIAPVVIFGFGDYLGMVGAFMVGMVAAILYIRTRTLLVPIAMHVLNKLLVIIASLIFPRQGQLETATAVEAVQSTVLPGVILLLLATPVLVWYLRKNWPSRDDPLPYEVSGNRPSPVDAAGL